MLHLIVNFLFQVSNQFFSRLEMEFPQNIFLDPFGKTVVLVYGKAVNWTLNTDVLLLVWQLRRISSSRPIMIPRSELNFVIDIRNGQDLLLSQKNTNY